MRSTIMVKAMNLLCSGDFVFMRKKIPIDFVPERSILTFIERVAKNKAKYKCECGVIKECFINCVKSGSILSCGCYNKKKLRERAKHRLLKHPLYRLWAGVKSRCTNHKYKSYKNYGGRGVVVCAEWYDNPEAFIKWCLENGWKKGLFLDKDIIALEKNVPEPLIYSPEWCRFVTRKENNNNTRYTVFITFNGMTKNIVQWAEHLGMVSNTLQNRLRRRGWSVERALTTPVGKAKKRK